MLHESDHQNAKCYNVHKNWCLGSHYSHRSGLDVYGYVTILTEREVKAVRIVIMVFLFLIQVMLKTLKMLL